MKLKERFRGGKPFNRYTLELWLRSRRGREMLSLEERELKRVLPDLFGRHVLQIGSWGRGDKLLESSEMLHRAVIGTVQNFGAQAVAQPERLPLAEKSVDAVVLPHALEFSPAPHPVLREVNRVLNDRGRLIILGFNPWSLWAWRQRLGLRDRAFPPGARFLSAGRLCDWLELLDFEVVEIRRFGIGFPWTAPATEHAHGLNHWFSTWSESYLVVAKKRVIPVTLIGRPQPARVRPLVGGLPVPGAHTRTLRVFPDPSVEAPPPARR